MKKSKVIVPAMALLLFSTAASITGTVAWFTSTRVFNTEASTFAVNSIDGNLEANVKGRVGTEALDKDGNPATGSGDAYNGAKVRNKRVAAVTGENAANAKEARLTHGSFNHADTNAWIIDNDSATTAYKSLGTEKRSYDDEAGSKARTDTWFRKSVTENTGTNESPVYKDYEYFSAFSWEINFKYTFGGGETKVGIFLDTDTSNITFTTIDGAVAGTELNLTGNGFRIAMYPVTVSGSSETVANPNDEARIFAKTANASELPAPLTGTYNAHYVTTTSSAGGTYSNRNYMVHTTNAGRVQEGPSLNTTAADARADKVCYITPAANSNVGEIRLICVAWFEGTSEFVVSSAEMDMVTATLNFYGRAIA